MQAEMRIYSSDMQQPDLDLKEGQAVISLVVPAKMAWKVYDAIKGLLVLSGHKVRKINSEGEEVVDAADVFPDANPAILLRGLRGKEDITQQELATKLGVSQNMISDMESGRRHISRNMAKRLEKEFNISYKVFL